ncbi:DUF1801 domain-containing protein [Mangrovibacterium diazotrophicum]|uniref:Uncharacterized protein DUF1801 n=1 Tax=Mangrovibacterium diazotrophicum TaxID=1261403 RepID=A0A419VW05_9BACT|nr:DUF1801 domain-containing protein [Mangrovibacterium diazotrophicum]RKD86325.1 uncharacterized protein DUF1801 [Mangrovibacterium diazotrophicum]
MAELKTKANDQSVEAFLQKVEPTKKRDDSFKLLEMMKRLSGLEPTMWGESIVGFGTYHYKYASGREGNWFQIGFSPRKQNFSVYLMSCDAANDLSDELERLGKHKTGKACLYFNKLADIDTSVLEEMIVKALKILESKPK